MAEVYLGRVGTVVELMMKRPTQPHPVTATLRRQEGEYMSMQHLAIPVSSLDCNLHPYKILERIRFAEKTLLQVRACARGKTVAKRLPTVCRAKRLPTVCRAKRLPTVCPQHKLRPCQQLKLELRRCRLELRRWRERYLCGRGDEACVILVHMRLPHTSPHPPTASPTSTLRPTPRSTGG
jgi:hypothetical protein